MTGKEKIRSYSVLLFDGECNLCNGLVQWVIKRDQRKQIRFSNLQSETALEILFPKGIDPRELNTFYYLKENDQLFSKSSAAIMLARDIGGFWRIAVLAYLIPKKWRDALYRLIAANRYKLFGRASECWLPSPELKARFL